MPFSIPRDHAVIEASARDLPVTVHAPDSPASRAYLTLAGVIAAPGWRQRRAAIDSEPFAPDAGEDDEGAHGPNPDEASALATLKDWKAERDAEVPPAALTPGPEPDPAWNEQIDEPAPAWMRTLRRVAIWILFFLAGFGLGLAVGLGRDWVMALIGG